MLHLHLMKTWTSSDARDSVFSSEWLKLTGSASRLRRLSNIVSLTATFPQRISRHRRRNNSGKWDIWLVNIEYGTDFNIELGEGYLLKSETASTWTVAGATPAPADPQYGGTLKIIGADPTGWDPGITFLHGSMMYTNPVTSRLVTLDWWKGLAGTSEWPFDNPWLLPPDDIYKGDLAESWNMPSPTSIVYTLRQGVMWQDKPGLMAAREVTADDIVWNFERYTMDPLHPLGDPTNPSRIETIVATGPYTVEFTFTQPSYPLPVQVIGTMYPMIPPEVVQQHGDMTDWRNVTGSGPFRLVDYVSGSAITYERNPNWHMKDPAGRSLPYIDGFQALIIPDHSTRLAALRTGQLDMVYGYASVGWQDAESLIATNPELEYLRKVSTTLEILQFDMKALPFGPNDDSGAHKVRRAAAMAIDRQAIIDDYYQGNAEMAISTMTPSLGIEALELENLPLSSQELFEYNPVMARQLLAEAGYPNGFLTTLNVPAFQVDIASIIKAYWEAVGIETEINVMDYGALTAIQWSHTMTDVMMLLWGTELETGWRFAAPGGVGTPGNFNGVNNAELNAPYDAFNLSLDAAGRLQLMTGMTLIVIDQAWETMVPSPDRYSFWQPWVKGYHGEDHVGYFGGTDVPAYIWIDESLR